MSSNPRSDFVHLYFLPLRKLGSSGPVVTNLGVGGAHVGSASERDAQAIIEKPLAEGVRFFDNAPFYSGGTAEERYGKFLTPKYRDVSFIMTKTLATNREDALKDLDASLSRMKSDYVDLWQVHALGSPRDVEVRVKNGVLDAFLEAQEKGKVRHIGFTGHESYKAHLKMLADGRFFGGNRGWRRTHVSVKPVIPSILSVMVYSRTQLF